MIQIVKTCKTYIFYAYSTSYKLLTVYKASQFLTRSHFVSETSPVHFSSKQFEARTERRSYVRGYNNWNMAATSKTISEQPSTSRGYEVLEENECNILDPMNNKILQMVCKFVTKFWKDCKLLKDHWVNHFHLKH